MALSIQRVRVDAPGGAGWPWSVPAVRSLCADGLDLGPLTVLVGENGSGKSTLVEGIASAFGLSHEGGSTGARHTTRASESALGDHLVLERGPGGPRWGFFLRAETMHGFYTYLEERPSARVPEPKFHEMSHGESFVEVLTRRMRGPGLYVLDEPESALSFIGSLALVRILRELGASGEAQVLVATHSPLVAATPGARILEVGEWGLREAAWAELDLVSHWQSFLSDPQVYLREL